MSWVDEYKKKLCCAEEAVSVIKSHDRTAINEGRADYVPIFLHQIPGLFLSGQMPLDVAILHVSPPDEHGFVSLGVEVLASKAAAETAKVVVRPVDHRL